MNARLLLILATCLVPLLPASAQEVKLEAPTVDEKAGTVSFSGKACKTDVYEQLKGQIEFVIALPKGKVYESCFEAAVDPLKLNDALKKIGAKVGKPAQDEKILATGDKIKITVTWKDGDKDRTEPVEAFILDEETKKPMEPKGWVFQGSKEGFVPDLGDMSLLVVQNKNLIGLYQGDPTPLLTNATGLMEGHRYKVNKAVLPKEGTVVKIVMQLAK